MPSLRKQPAKSVRFRESAAGAVRTPKGRLVRSKQVDNAAVVEENDSQQAPPDNEGESQRSPSADNNEEEEEEEEEGDTVVAPITTALEVRRIVDNVRGLTPGTTVKMSCWNQPDNEISDDNILLREMCDLKFNCESWCDEYCSLRDEWSGYTLREVDAEVTQKGQGRQPFRYDLNWYNISKYRRMYTKVRELHYEGAKGVRVIVNIHIWLKSATPPTQDSQTAPPSSQKKRARGETVTEKQTRMNQIDRDAARAIGNFVNDIWQEWACHDKNCEGYQKPCWISKDGGHCQLSQDNLKRWSEQVSAGNVTVKECPDSLQAALLHERLTQRNSRKRKKSKNEPIQQPQLPVNIIMNPWGGQLPGHQALPLEPRSSPPFQTGADLDNLGLYIDWLVKERKVSKDHASLAKQGLLDGGFGFNFLRDVLDIEWSEMGVPRGVRLVILRSQKTWQQSMVREELAAARKAKSTINISDDDETEEGDELSDD